MQAARKISSPAVKSPLRRYRKDPSRLIWPHLAGGSLVILHFRRHLKQPRRRLIVGIAKSCTVALIERAL
jgi:hypothetical protein